MPRLGRASSLALTQLNNNQMGFDDDEPMDMDAAFAEPAMPKPEPEAVKEEAADTTSVLSADEKDARIAELEKQLSKRKPTLPPLPMRS